MKKLNLLLGGGLTATLLLGACGNEENKAESQDNKSESVDKKKEEPKKDETKKEDKAKETEESKEVTDNVSTEEPTTQESVEQPVTQDEPAPVEQEQQAELTEQEKIEANAEWNRQNVKGGTDAGMLDSSAQADGYYSNDQLDPETGLPKDDAIPHENGEGPTEDEVAQGEKEALREKYDGGLSSGEIQTKHAIEQGYYDGENEDEIMAEIEKSEQEIAEGKYDQYK